MFARISPRGAHENMFMTALTGHLEPVPVHIVPAAFTLFWTLPSRGAGETQTLTQGTRHTERHDGSHPEMAQSLGESGGFAACAAWGGTGSSVRSQRESIR